MESCKSAGVGLLACVIVACAGGESRWAGTVSDSAGVAIISNSDIGLWRPGEEWTVDEDLRIGAVDGAPEYQFGRVGSVVADSRGRLYVLDLLEQHVQVYSPEGVYDRTIGGRGQGPGEFGSVPYIVMGPGDTLMALDIRNQRLNRITSEGTALASFPFSMTDGIPLSMQANRSGDLALQLRPWGAAGQPPAQTLEDVIVIPNSDWTLNDSVLTFPSGEGQRYTAGGPPQYNIGAPEAAWDLSEDGTLLFGVSDEYRIEVRAYDGTLLRVVKKPFVPRPFSERDKEAYRNFLRDAYRQAGSPEEIEEFLRHNVRFNEHLPAFAAIRAGPARTIWVQHAQAPSDLDDTAYQKFDNIRDGGAPEWDVFDLEGRFLGVVTMPERFAPSMFRDRMIYGVWRDELDVEYVLRLRIVGDLRAGTM
jgi:hypothetical protein